VWNESFTFDITHGNDPLKIVIMDKDRFGGDDFEGQALVNLKNTLSDQMKKDDWFTLTDKTGKPAQGRVRLMLQWVYSRV
jgi:Ca2+-dependent lipid-binding protein